MSKFDKCTILLHGNITQRNIQETIESIRAWRRVYPGSPIIFSASDFARYVGEEEIPFWQKKHLKELEWERETLKSLLRPEVDDLRWGIPVPALPPLKFDDKVNNCNKMISSVQAGLAGVETEYLVRIRSDGFLKNAHVVADWQKLHADKGLKSSCFDEPVAVSPFFTINPYLLERMAFHVSDWFNVGRTDDIRKIWDVSFYSYEDAIHFQSYDHADHSYTNERMMRARIPPEQYLSTTLASKMGIEVPGFFNETGYERSFVDFLRENFIVSDHSAIGLSMPKYQQARTSLQTRYLCILHNDWRKMVEDGTDAWIRSMMWKLKWVKWRQRRDRKHRNYRWLKNKLVHALAFVYRS